MTSVSTVNTGALVASNYASKAQRNLTNLLVDYLQEKEQCMEQIQQGRV